MPRLTISVVDRQQMFGAGLDKRLAEFKRAEQRARAEAAKVATTFTRANFHYKREIIPSRPGRSSTGGQMAQHLSWVNDPATGSVEFDIHEADQNAPHWIIQEIGTGQRATIKQGGAANPVGRPATGASYVRTVRSQRGRRISGGLVFASGGRWTPPGVRRDEQLHWASTVRGVPYGPGGQAAAIRITREIQGQHFVKKGGQEGFRRYQTSVLAAARQAFRKSNLP